MTFISFIGIIAAIILIIYVSVRELNIIIASPLATLIVLITNQMPTSLSSTVGPLASLHQLYRPLQPLLSVSSSIASKKLALKPTESLQNSSTASSFVHPRCS